MYGVNGYGVHREDRYDGAVKDRNTGKKATDTKTAGAERAEKQAGVSGAKLSDKAKALLEKLKKTYGNMDFMVADYDSEEDAKQILSRGTKEFSVLFSSDELEKMASDESYEKEYLGRMENAVRMSEQIDAQFGFESAQGKNSNETAILGTGVSFNKDGSMTFFAELEKVSEKQRERIEKAKERGADERDLHIPSKRTEVTASSLQELMDKINHVDWSKIRESEPGIGDKYDFGV